MGLGQLALLAWRNLWRNRRRTVITLASIAFGMFLALFFTALQDRSFADMIDVAARMNGGHVVLQHPEYLDTPSANRTVQPVSALEAHARADADVEHVVERVMGQVMLSTAHGSTGTMVLAYDPRQESEATLDFLDGIVAGEAFTDPAARALVLGVKLARDLHAELDSKVVYTLVDSTGELRADVVRVTGLIETGSPSVDAGLALMPIGMARATLGYGPDEAVRIGVFLDDSRRSDAVARRLDAVIGAGADALSWDQVIPELSGFIAMKVGGAIFMEIVIGLLVAASIFNTLFVSVMERMREFGVQLAIGYSPRQIFGMIMFESLWLALVGVVAGLALFAGPYAYLSTYGLDLSGMAADVDSVEVAGVGVSMVVKAEIFPEHFWFIVGAVIVATLAAGLYPAIKAGRVEPVDVLQVV